MSFPSVFVSGPFLNQELLDFVVMLDTGSSDLWVRSNTSLKPTNDSGITANVSYGVGFAAWANPA